MKKILSVLVVMLFGMSVMANEVQNVSADEALQKLKTGNENFRKEQMKHPHQTKADRVNLVAGQHPFAVVITCSDSRTPAEIIFDQGLGDIFVIRNAGNVIDEHVIGSVEYAVEHLGVKLVLVMGHDNCGVITAAVKGGVDSKYIGSLVNSVKPALEKAKKDKQGCSITAVAKDNAIIGAEELVAQDAVIKELVQNKGLKVVPAFYYLNSGEVEILKK